MPEWKPALNPGVDLRGLPLTPEEGFIASRLDGATDLHGISQVTGMNEASVGAALEKLISHGAVSRPKGAEPAESVEASEALGSEQAAEEPETDEASEEPSEPRAIHRKLYESTLRQLTSDARAVKAREAIDPELSAFCFDPLPAVVQSLLENPRFGLVQARLVAAHHRTPSGLEALCAKAAFAADLGVRRALLRNPQLPAALFRRLHANRRLLEQYKLAASRELPELTKVAARELLRGRFATADGDERVEVIVKSEGRCLQLLSGLPIDGKTASLLCNRSYTSSLFIQNLARWSVAPGALIAHLLKQELVKRSPPLRNALLRHPNAPAAEKR
ncbi:MAG TPA: hypothetical protein VH083_24910 [Myxococcales bacterium]|jgi:hypothetical protein|nr:hypothetical protein [Myxococcales bacterium]